MGLNQRPWADNPECSEGATNGLKGLQILVDAAGQSI